MVTNKFDLGRLMERRKTTLSGWLSDHKITTVDELARELEGQGLFASPTLIAEAINLLEPVQAPQESILLVPSTTETTTEAGITDKAPGESSVEVVVAEPKPTKKKLSSKTLPDPV